jgi:two-component system, NtrC family, sensor kinase
VSTWPIRKKLLFGLGLLLVLVGTLAVSGIQGVNAYRNLVRVLRARSAELPKAAAINAMVSDLRMTVGEIHGFRQGSHQGTPEPAVLASFESRFASQLRDVHKSVTVYRDQLNAPVNEPGDYEVSISDSSRESQTVQQIDSKLNILARTASRKDWTADNDTVTRLTLDVATLDSLVAKLPTFLHEDFDSLYHEVRNQYRTWIVLEWVTVIGGAILLLLLVKLSYDWVIQPLRLIIRGSRRVAAGDFDYRIRLSSRDEMQELAEALNAMTVRFQQTRDDLDRQVAERTKQVIRSEQLASVGFLAAGVAHEINNPLASIAMCAESLEGRVDEVLAAGHQAPEAERDVIRHYLQMIQTEAFRCKGITERLLDFSRRGDSERHATELRELVTGVIEMVGHLGKYHGTHIEFEPGEPLVAQVNSPQIKQVVLNLVTNGLESLSPGGTVRVAVRKHAGNAEISFTDDGCGMTAEVREHLFEPFFTRRRAGQGIGLGLSITYRIIADHQGHIDVHSDGPDRGSRFTVRLPLNPTVALPRIEDSQEVPHRNQAA